FCPGDLKRSTQALSWKGEMEWMRWSGDMFEVLMRWQRRSCGPHGGIRPAPRRRSRLALTLAEREEISRGIAGAPSMRSMARLLGHAPSTISREIKRGGGR